MNAVGDLRRRYGALTSDDVARLDRASVECGVSVTQLMEVAGWQVARCAWRWVGETPVAVAVVAGHGNNGGDALVAARHLRTWGCDVHIHVVSSRDRIVGLVATHLAAAERCEIPTTVGTDADAIAPAARVAVLVLDGLLGTGLSGEPREPARSAIRVINAASRSVLSIDVPSGLDATSGFTPDTCVRATVTCTLAAMKAGLWAASARDIAGRIEVADIGLPAAAWKRCGLEQPTEVRGAGFSSLPSLTA